MEEKKINHFIKQCPKWAQQRGGYFNSFYLSVIETVDKVPIHQIIWYIGATKRFSSYDKKKHKGSGLTIGPADPALHTGGAVLRGRQNSTLATADS